MSFEKAVVQRVQQSEKRGVGALERWSWRVRLGPGWSGMVRIGPDFGWLVRSDPELALRVGLDWSDRSRIAKRK